MPPAARTQAAASVLPASACKSIVAGFSKDAFLDGDDVIRLDQIAQLRVSNDIIAIFARAFHVDTSIAAARRHAARASDRLDNRHAGLDAVHIRSRHFAVDIELLSSRNKQRIATLQCLRRHGTGLVGETLQIDWITVYNAAGVGTKDVDD